MKALYFKSHGTIKNLEFGTLPDPTPSASEVVIKVKACALNHLDLWVLEGWPGLKLHLPHVGGSDISGEIHSVGEDVSGWKKGQRVVVNPGIATVEDEWTKKGEESVSPGYRIIGEHRPGGFAEYVKVPAKNLLELPDDVGFSEGAAPLLVATTAWRMLKHRAKLQSGETVLVVGAGGGLNSFSIQLSKYLGATVIALTSSTEKAKKAIELGADHVIDYVKNPGWNIEVYKITNKHGADVVIDNVGEKTITESIRSAARGGRIVTVGNTSGHTVKYDNRFVFVKQLSILGSTMGSAADFEEAVKTIWKNPESFKPVIDRAVPLKDGKGAYKLLKDGRQFGKIILIP